MVSEVYVQPGTLHGDLSAPSFRNRLQPRSPDCNLTLPRCLLLSPRESSDAQLVRNRRLNLNLPPRPGFANGALPTAPGIPIARLCPA